MGTATYAVEVDDLYQSRTAIVSQNDQVREQATVKILQQVLLKVVGNQAALANKDLSPLLKQADQFVAQYAYLRDPTHSDSGLQLQLTFNEKALNQAISAMGLPIWKKSRPESVVWLVVNDANKQKILGAEDESQTAYRLMKQTTEKRGLPIFLPLMDLQDQHQIRFAQTATKLTEDNVFVQASKRYGADMVILARLNKDKDDVSVDWQWLKSGELQRYQSIGTMDVAVAMGINHIADTLAGQFAIIDQQASKRDYQLVISDINDFTDFQECNPI